MITQYKHKTKPNLFHFHKDGAPMSDPSEEIAGIRNWEPLGRVAGVPEHLRDAFFECGYCKYSYIEGRMVLVK